MFLHRKGMLLMACSGRNYKFWASAIAHAVGISNLTGCQGGAEFPQWVQGETLMNNQEAKHGSFGKPRKVFFNANFTLFYKNVF